jgi:hypothetical protein
MMGTKARGLVPLCNLSLETLVAADRFYRHVEAKLGPSFVRDSVVVLGEAKSLGPRGKEAETLRFAE